MSLDFHLDLITRSMDSIKCFIVSLNIILQQSHRPLNCLIIVVTKFVSLHNSSFSAHFNLKEMFEVRAKIIFTLIVWRNHLLHYHHPNCLPTFVCPRHLHQLPSSLH